MKVKVSIRVIWTVGAVALGIFLLATALHPIWALKVAFLALASLFLAALASFFARKIKRPVQKTWVDWVALGTAGLTLWWLFWIPHLLLPFSLQVLCRILGISLSLVAAVALHRALPRRLCRLGALVPPGPHRAPCSPLATSLLFPVWRRRS